MMLNTPWETASPLYRKLVVWALSLTGTGIILVLIGSVAKVQPLMLAAMPLIAVGLATHIAGMVIRSRDVRRLQRELKAAGR